MDLIVKGGDPESNRGKPKPYSTRIQVEAAGVPAIGEGPPITCFPRCSVRFALEVGDVFAGWPDRSGIRLPEEDDGHSPRQNSSPTCQRCMKKINGASSLFEENIPKKGLLADDPRGNLRKQIAFRRGSHRPAQFFAARLAASQGDVPQPQFQDMIASVDYEKDADILDAAHDHDAAKLAEFLRNCIHNVLG